MKDLKEISILLNYPSDKDTSHNYLPVYQQEFDKIEDIKILEIGVCFGGSLVLWNEFFVNSEIHGIDNVKYSDDLFPGIMYWGNYQDLCNDFEDNYFDYIINDSLHYAEDQIEAFDLYYSKLKPGGKFFMEDIPNEMDIMFVFAI
jgi:SAM-dependent methyltransferase